LSAYPIVVSSGLDLYGLPAYEEDEVVAGFGWDPLKAARNLRKHGVDFEVAKDVFRDPAAIIEPDDSDPDEERWCATGFAGGKVLFVVFTERDDDVTRIISARKANKREERAYLGQATP
jgi:uncharacterized protein